MIYVFFLRNVTNQGQCLQNVPLQATAITNVLAGAFYTADEQCRLILGPDSNYRDCEVSVC
jgi:hypothetical protein